MDDGTDGLVSVGYRLLLCHRRADGVRAGSIRGHWMGPRQRLVAELAGDLGHSSYEQLHQLDRGNVVYRALRLSRSRLVVALLTAVGERRLPRLGNGPTGEPAWDVIEHLRFGSKQALVSSLTSAAGRTAAHRLVDDQDGWTSASKVVIAEDHPVTTEMPGASPEVAVMFFLRAKAPLDREGLLRYWATDHEKLVRSVGPALGFTSYAQLHGRSDPELASVVELFGGAGAFGGAGEEYDGVAELAYAELKVLLRGLFRLRTQSANLKLVRDEITFIDIARSTLVLGRFSRRG